MVTEQRISSLFKNKDIDPNYSNNQNFLKTFFQANCLKEKKNCYIPETIQAMEKEKMIIRKLKFEKNIARAQFQNTLKIGYKF